MASFHIYQDSEKENPCNMQTVKEKPFTAPLNKVHNVLQPSAFSGLVSSAAAGIKQQQTQQRSNSVLLNNGNNTNAIGINKKKQVEVYRDAPNIRENDENAGFQKKAVFTVYEDCTEDVENPTVTHHNIKKANQSDNNGTVLHELQSTNFEPFFGVSNTLNRTEKYALETTPMSVADVLSQMSVDRSLSMGDSTNDENIVDEDNNQKLLNSKPTAIQRDRDRFFEVVEYQADILEYFRESELKHRPKPHYMRRQSDINQSMRTIMVDWLVEVSEEYNLDTETLYLAVSYTDRFLSQMSVMRNKLQLVGTSAMYIAAKYEEIYPPEVNDFVFITDDTFNKTQILRMEQIILKILSFDLCTPTPYVYINMYAAIIKMNEKYKALVLYIAELSLLEADPYLNFLPSVISAGACALATYTLFDKIWTKELEEVTAYKIEDLKEIFLCLSKTHNNSVNYKLQAIQDKYKASKYYNISTLEPMSEVSSELFDYLAHEYNEHNKQKNDIAQSPTSVKVNENVRRMISLMFHDKPNTNSEIEEKFENVTVAKD